MFPFSISIILYACGEKPIQVPGGTQNQNTNTENTEQVECAESWEQAEEGYWLDPTACVAWSPLSDTLNWFEAVSSSEASTGGCDQICDLDEAVNYCADLSLGGLSWRTPSIAELKDVTTRNPPFSNLDADLWSRDSDPLDELAWTANAEQPGMEISLDKTGLANVRCIAD